MTPTEMALYKVPVQNSPGNSFCWLKKVLPKTLNFGVCDDVMRDYFHLNV